MSLDDPIDFKGLRANAIRNDDDSTRRKPGNNAATGVTAAGSRALLARAVAFYFRAPVKAFFRTRVDYLAYAKSINPRIQSGEFSWRTTTPGLLTHAVKTFGWRFIPEQVLPPLFANAAVGAILYTSYLQILGAIHEPSSQSAKRVFPPPSPGATFIAGYAAGGIQSFVAAPLDALQVRFENREKHYDNKSMWAYGKGKLKDIGMRGIFAGWGLSFLKDSLGSAVFFSVFEYVKAQSYYRFVATYYGSLQPWVVTSLVEVRGIPSTSHHDIPIIKPHYVLEPSFLMLAGVAASVAQQGIIYPLNKIQTMHYERLEELDKKARAYHRRSQAPGRMMRAYYQAYQETWRQCKVHAHSTGGLRKLLFRSFWWNSIKQTPATSAGLVVFELVRRRYGVGNEEVKINEDGYDILLS